MNLVDTHCHINFDSYGEDRDGVIMRASDVGVTQIINPAIDLATSRAALQMAAQYPNIFAAVGIHPNSSKDFANQTGSRPFANWRNSRQSWRLAKSGWIIIGTKARKKNSFGTFEAQLALAAALELPVIIHNREASEDVIVILERWAARLPKSLRERCPGVLHSFSAPQDCRTSISNRFLPGFYGANHVQECG